MKIRGIVRHCADRQTVVSDGPHLVRSERYRSQELTPEPTPADQTTHMPNPQRDATAAAPQPHKDGVFYRHPAEIPEPPPGSVGVIIYANGIPICAGWAIGEHEDVHLARATHAYLEIRTIGTSDAKPLLRIVP